MQEWGISVLFEGQNLFRLVEGLSVSIRIAAVSIAFSAVCGILLGILMT